MRRSIQAIVSRNLRVAVRITAILVLATVFLPGCLLFKFVEIQAGQFDRDLSSDEQQWSTSGFVYGGTYETKEDLFLMDLKGYSHGPGLALGKGEEYKYVPVGRFYWGGPTTPELYRRSPERWPEVTGIVDAGTRIKVVELREEGNTVKNMETTPYVKGEILTGTYAGTKVDLLEISVYDPENKKKKEVLLGPHPRLLTLVPEN